MSAPGTMLGLAARENWRALKLAQRSSPGRARLRTVARALLATMALAIGLSGLSTSSAQAFPWDDMKDNMAATIVNMCRPNDLARPYTYTNIDSMAGLNASAPREGYRSTIKPDFTQDGEGTQGGDGMERLQRVYGDRGDVIAKPTYERYGFSTLQWRQYGYDCISPTTMMGPLANVGLMSMVHVPMMLAMAILNFVMGTALYTGFASLMQPFIGAMYAIFNPWIYFIVPIGVAITWLGSRGSLTATLKAAGWGVMILAVYLLMGSSTSKIVTWSTNVVTEVSGAAACKMEAASQGQFALAMSNLNDMVAGEPQQCDVDNPIKAVQQSLWYGIPYQTWHLGQVGEHQAQLDETALAAGEVGWGPAILNGQYVGVDENGNVDESGQSVLEHTERWNRSTYSPSADFSKGHRWTTNNAWVSIPALANIKIMCNDVGGMDDEKNTDPSAKTRWMYSGNDGTNNWCDSAGANTETMIPHITGDAYAKQFLVALSGMIGVAAVVVTIVATSLYLGFQKMMFFFLLFLAPIVLLVSAIGDRKRRPFAIRYAEIVGANILKQIAAVCIVLFVSYAMASLFGSSTFGAIPWIMKPYVALLFVVALAFLAFPLKSMIQGAIQGDTSVLDKQATAPQRALKTGAKVAAVGTAVVATGGVGLAAVGGVSGIAPAIAAAGGKGAVLGKAGSMLGQAGRVMGIGSKTGRAMRAGGQLLRAGQGVMHARDDAIGRKIGTARAAATLLQENPEKYRGRKADGTLGDLLPGAQKRALQDAQATAERGQRVQRAKSTHDAFMRDFAAGWGGPTSQDNRPAPSPKADPRPDSRPLPPGGDAPQLPPGRGPAPDGPQEPLGPNPARRSSETSETHTDADSVGTRSGNAPSATGPTTGQSPTAPGSPSASSGEGEAQAPTPAMPYEKFAEKSRENLGGMAFTQQTDYNVSTVRSGEDVLSSAGLSKDQVIANPTVLLSGDAYNGGSTTAMDPFHPATASLNELRFASSSGDEDAIQAAVAKAVDSISEHGVPSQISGVNSIGERAERFDPVELVGAMPQLSEISTWEERADAAHTMMAAQVALPADAPPEVRESVEVLTAQLARPGVPIADVAVHEADAIEAVSWWQNERMSEIEDVAPTRESIPSDVAAESAPPAGDGHAPVSYEQHDPAVGAGSASLSDTNAPSVQAREETYPADPANAGHGAPSPEDLRAAVADGLREARHEHDASDVGGAPGQYGAPAAPEPTGDSHLPANPAPVAEAPLGTESVPPQGSTSGSAPTSGLSYTPSPAEYSDDEPVDAVEDSEALIWPGESHRIRKKGSGFFDQPEDAVSEDDEEHDE